MRDAQLRSPSCTRTAVGVAPRVRQSGMIKMCARELFQEMVTRLGGAHGPAETAIPSSWRSIYCCRWPADRWGGRRRLALGAAHVMLTCGGGAVSLLSSLDVTGRNQQLVAYIDANAMMLLDFLRVRIEARTRRPRTRRWRCMHCTSCSRSSRPTSACRSGGGARWSPRSRTRSQPALQAQALAVIRTFVTLLQEEQLARALAAARPDAPTVPAEPPEGRRASSSRSPSTRADEPPVGGASRRARRAHLPALPPAPRARARCARAATSRVAQRCADPRPLLARRRARVARGARDGRAAAASVRSAAPSCDAERRRGGRRPAAAAARLCVCRAPRSCFAVLHMP